MLTVFSGTARSLKARSIIDGCGAPEPSRSSVKPFPNKSRAERAAESQACGARLPGKVVGWYSTVEAGRGATPSPQTIGDDASGLNAYQILAHLAPGFRARRRIHGDLGMGRLLALVVVAETGMTDIANADRAALRLVALEKPRAAPAGNHRRQLPAEVDRVAEAGVEAKPCGRMIEVRRIAREENAAMTVVVVDNI